MSIATLLGLLAGAAALADEKVDRFVWDAGVGRIDPVRAALDAGMDPNLADSFKVTALYRAASQNRVEVMRLLLDRGAQVDLGTQSGDTPIGVATGMGHEDAVRLLHARGAALDRDNGRAPLLRTVSHPPQPKMVAVLLELGADPNVTDINGKTARHWAAQYAFVDIVRMLLANPRTRLSPLDERGYTPLYHARQAGRSFAAQRPADASKTVALLEAAGARERSLNPRRVWTEFVLEVGKAFASH